MKQLPAWPLVLVAFLPLFGLTPACRDWDQREVEVSADALCSQLADAIKNQPRVWTELVKSCVTGDAVAADCADQLGLSGISESAFQTKSGTDCLPTPDQTAAEQRAVESRCLVHQQGRCSLCLAPEAVKDLPWDSIWSAECGKPGCRDCLAQLDCRTSDTGCETDVAFNACSAECYLNAFACSAADEFLVIPEVQTCDLVVDCPSGVDETTEGGGEGCDITCRDFAGLSNVLSLDDPNAIVNASQLCSARNHWEARFSASDLRNARDVTTVQFQDPGPSPFCLEKVSYRIDEGPATEISGDAIGVCEDDPELSLPTPLQLQGHSLLVSVTLADAWLQFAQPRTVALAVSSGDDPETPLGPPSTDQACALHASPTALDELGCLSCDGGPQLAALLAEGRSHLLRNCDCTGWQQSGDLYALPLACDGIENCASGVDEDPALCCEVDCDCASALNVRASLVCNGVVNCAGGEDESVCEGQCDIDYLGDGYCDAANNVSTCAWDLGDCCQSDCRDGDSACGDGGFCCQDPDSADYVPNFTCEGSCRTEWISDGLCDPANNVPDCEFDGGDCCPSLCQDPSGQTCGSAGYCCLDPSAMDYAPDACTG